MALPVVYLLLAALVAVCGQSVTHKGSRDIQPDPASKFLGVLTKHLEREKLQKQRTTPQPAYHNTTTATGVQDIVYERFQDEMQRLFRVLPEKDRCKYLNELARTIHCNVTTIIAVLRNVSVMDKEMSCTSKGASRIPTYITRNETATMALFWNKMARIFNTDITVPFKCNIVNSITSRSPTGDKNTKRSTNKRIRINLKTVESQLESIFPFLKIKGKCANVWKPLKRRVPLQMPASLLNVTVRLNPGTQRKSWLKDLKAKARAIYSIYVEYHRKGRKQRPLIPQMNSPSRVPAASYNSKVRIGIIRVTRFNGTVSVIFKLEVSDARLIYFKRISPANLIIVALLSKSESFRDSLFDAKVLRISRAQKEQSTQKYLMKQRDITRLRQLFPQYLKGYYKQLDPLERCLIMLFISSTVQIDLRPTELLYNTFKYIPRKYFCSSRSRMSSFNPIIDQKQTYRAKGTSTPKVYQDASPSQPAATLQGPILRFQNGNQSWEDPEYGDIPEDDYSPEEKGVTALEIVLFTLLGLLCVAILVFTVNCIIFALKPKSTDGNQPNSAFAKAIFRKIPSTDSSPRQQERVQVTLHPHDDPTVLKTFAERCCHNDGATSSSANPHGQTSPVNTCRKRTSHEDVSITENHRDETLTMSVTPEDVKGSPQRTNSQSSCGLKCTCSYMLESTQSTERCTCDNMKENKETTCSNDSLASSRKANLDECCACSKSSSRSNSCNSLNKSRGELRRTIKEGSGELKILCESGNDSSGSLEDSGGIKRSNCTVMVVLDRTEETTVDV